MRTWVLQHIECTHPQALYALGIQHYISHNVLPVNKPSTDRGLCIQAIIILGTMFQGNRQNNMNTSTPSVHGLMPVTALCVNGMCYQYSLHLNSALLQQLLQQVLQFAGHLFTLITVSLELGFNGSFTQAFLRHGKNQAGTLLSLN